MNEYPDSELINLVCERSEEASNLLYEKYNYIIDIIYNKYRKSAYYLSVDLSELKQEAMVGFSDALVSYDQNKNVSLPTFITLCVERRVQNYVRNADTNKMRIMREAYSLDADYSVEDKTPLIEKIGDDKLDPQREIEDIDNVIYLKKKINEVLSPSEKEVYDLIINDFSYEDIAKITNKSIKSVYSTVQRIRLKIKNFL